MGRGSGGGGRGGKGGGTATMIGTVSKTIPQSAAMMPSAHEIQNRGVLATFTPTPLNPTGAGVVLRGSQGLHFAFAGDHTNVVHNVRPATLRDVPRRGR